MRNSYARRAVSDDKSVSHLKAVVEVSYILTQKGIKNHLSDNNCIVIGNKHYYVTTITSQNENSKNHIFSDSEIEMIKRLAKLSGGVIFHHPLTQSFVRIDNLGDFINEVKPNMHWRAVKKSREVIDEDGNPTIISERKSYKYYLTNYCELADKYGLTTIDQKVYDAFFAAQKQLI